MDAQDIIIQQLVEKIFQLEKIVAEQAVIIAELKKRLGKNSNNSSKPPSSDGLTKPPRTNSLRQQGKNKSGGQPGHKGETLKQVEHPDMINRHPLHHCSECTSSLESTPVEAIIRRQIFDIPPPKMLVTEHQAEVKICPCCKNRVTSAFPAGVNASAQYGDVIKSWAEGRGRIARRTGHNLLLRLSNYRDDVLRFLFDSRIPFTNNQAEQDIRMMKCKQKISGGFRSIEGAKVFTRIRGFISTCRKQRWKIFDSIQSAICGNVPLPI